MRKFLLTILLSLPAITQATTIQNMRGVTSVAGGGGGITSCATGCNPISATSASFVTINVTDEITVNDVTINQTLDVSQTINTGTMTAYNVSPSSINFIYGQGETLAISSYAYISTLTVYGNAQISDTLNVFRVETSTVSAAYIQSNEILGNTFQAGVDYQLQGNSIVVPAGMLMLSSHTCPSGWAEYVGAAGYYLVGNQTTVAGTVGSAMTDLQNSTHDHGSEVFDDGNIATRTVGDNVAVSRGTIAPYIQLRLCGSP